MALVMLSISLFRISGFKQPNTLIVRSLALLAVNRAPGRYSKRSSNAGAGGKSREVASLTKNDKSSTGQGLQSSISSTSRRSSPSRRPRSRSSSTYAPSDPSSTEGTRLNKCILELSRRAADESIQKGLVTVNNEIITNPGHKVQIGDKVKYKNKIQNWSDMVTAKQKSMESLKLEDRDFIYLKYWKPAGVTSTSDPKDR